jgi:hypothetical protein
MGGWSANRRSRVKHDVPPFPLLPDGSPCEATRVRRAYVTSWEENGSPVHVQFRVAAGPGAAVIAAVPPRS